MKTRAHHWIVWATVSRRLCCTCGLVELHNDASIAAAKAPCRGATP